MKKITILILFKYFLIGCGGDNIPSYNNNTDHNINTGSERSLNNKIERYDEKIKTIGTKIKDFEKNNSKKTKKDYIPLELLDDYFNLCGDIMQLNKKIGINWIYYLKETLDRYDKNKTKIKIISSAKDLEEKKYSKDLKEKISKLIEKKEQVKGEILNSEFLNNRNEFIERVKKINSINYEYKVLIEHNNEIIKLLNQIEKRDGEVFGEKNDIIKKEEIDNILKEIKQNKKSFDKIDDIKNTEKDKLQKETLYATSLEKGLNKIKEYIQFDK